MRRIIEWSVKFRALLVVLAAGLVILGLGALRTAPVDTLPEFTAPVVQIQTESLGLSAAEVEQLLTVPMEQDLLNGVKGALTIRSDSVPGLSSIDLTFARGTDILRARQLIQERLTQAFALPGVGTPPQMLQPTSSSNHVMIIGLKSRKLSPIALSVLARWTIKPRLMGLPGVASVAIWGMRDRQFQVLVDPAVLHAHGVTLNQVIATAGNAQLVSRLTFLEASTPGTGGFFDAPNQRLAVRHVLPFGAPRDLAQVPVEGTQGKHAVPLGSVAVLAEAHQPLIGDAVVHGGSGLILAVDKVPGANTLAVTREIDQALSDMAPGLGGTTVDSSIYRPATYIESAMHNITVALIAAAVLAALVLLAFLRRLRAVLVGLVTILLSLIVALLVLDLEGQTVNLLVIAGLGIALGVVVDEAVGAGAGIAGVLDERRARKEERSTSALVVQCTSQLRGAAGYATLIVLLLAVPVLVAHGLTASFVYPMALAFALAAAASMLVALTVASALTALLAGLPSRPVRRAARLSGFADIHRRVFSAAARARFLTIGATALGVCGVVAVVFLIAPRTPAFKDRDLMVSLQAPPGTSLPEMKRLTTRVADALRSTPGIRDTGAEVGRAITGDQIVGTNSSTVWVSMVASASYDPALASVRNVVDHVPGISGSVSTYEAARTEGVLGGSHDEVTVRIYGADYGVLGREAQRIKRVMSSVRGVGSPRVLLPVEQPVVQVKVNLGAALSRGLKPGDVRRAEATLVSGTTVGNFFEQQKVFDVVVRGVPRVREGLTSMRRLLIDKPGGGQVPLGSVAHVSTGREPLDIRHDAVSRFVDVRAPVRVQDAGSVRAEIQRDMRQLAMPLDYHAKVVGPPADGPTSGGSFLTFVLAAGLGIFLLLQAAFGRWRLAAIVMAMLPASALGGVAVAVATGNGHALGAAAGLAAVFALGVRQTVVLIRGVQLVEASQSSDRLAAVWRAVDERRAPLLASAMITAAAVAPFAVLGDVAGNEITFPMSLVILGGLATMLALVLILIPAAYARLPWEPQLPQEPPSPPLGIEEKEEPWRASAPV